METYYVVRVGTESETFYARYAGGYELAPCFGDAHMHGVRFRAEAMARRHRACGCGVDICELGFRGSYEV